MYVYLNVNPDKKKTSDCVVRAISLATGRDWDTTFLYLAIEALLHHDMMDVNYVWGGYLLSNGFIRGKLPDTCPNCYTVNDFCIDYPIGTYVLGTGTHAVCVIDGNYYDVFDSGDEVPVYFYEKIEDM